MVFIVFHDRINRPLLGLLNLILFDLVRLSSELLKIAANDALSEHFHALLKLQSDCDRVKMIGEQQFGLLHPIQFLLYPLIELGVVDVSLVLDDIFGNGNLQLHLLFLPSGLSLLFLPMYYYVLEGASGEECLRVANNSADEIQAFFYLH